MVLVLKQTGNMYVKCQLCGILLKREGPNYKVNNKSVMEHVQEIYHQAGCLRHWAAVRYTSSLLHHSVDSISPFITAVLVHGKQVLNTITFPFSVS